MHDWGFRFQLICVDLPWVERWFHPISALFTRELENPWEEIVKTKSR